MKTKKRLIQIKSDHDYKIKVYDAELQVITTAKITLCRLANVYIKRIDFNACNNLSYMKLTTTITNPSYHVNLCNHDVFFTPIMMDNFPHEIFFVKGTNCWIKVIEERIELVASNHEILELESLCI